MCLPLLRGSALNGYIAAGIRTEHEATTPEEAMEKLSKGMTVLIREGSVSKDLHALAPILTERTAPFLAFCTDDRNPLDIAEEGHLDFIIRTAIALGAPPLAAYRAASWSAARAFGLHDRGLVAPGQRADLVVLDELATCAVSRVFAAGQPVEDALFAGRPSVAPIGRNSVRARSVTAADFAAPGSGPSTPVIGVVPPDLVLKPSEAEVAAVFEVPLDYVLDTANHLEATVEWQGRNRHYYEILWGDHRIWGATAAMIVNLSRRLQWIA